MKNLIHLILKAVLLIWIVIFCQCLTMQEVQRESHLKLIQDIELPNTIKKLGENPTAPIWLERQSILLVILQEKDLKYYQHCKMSALTDLELEKPLSMSIMMKTNLPLLFGLTSTAGNTLNYGKETF